MKIEVVKSHITQHESIMLAIEGNEDFDVTELTTSSAVCPCLQVNNDNADFGSKRGDRFPRM
jgi:hypothetical protein